MSTVMSMLKEIFRDSPEIRPHSPPIRPVGFGDITAFSHDSPESPGREWKSGNPYTCITCGEKTGWTTECTPLCPACVPLDDPEQYRKEMLDWADELEQVALTTADPEMRDVRMSVVTAIRAECSFSKEGE
jgi:hypothetical protein